MKKSLLLTAVLGVVLLISACSPASRIELLAKAASAECPMVLEDGIVCADITTEGNNLVYVCVVDENDDFSVADFQNSYVKSMMKNFLKDALVDESDEELKELISLCREAKYNIVYRYNGKDSGQSADIVIGWYEL